MKSVRRWKDAQLPHIYTSSRNEITGQNLFIDRMLKIVHKRKGENN